MDKVQKINKCLSWDKEWGCSTSPMKTCDSCLEAKWETVKENPEEHNEDLDFQTFAKEMDAIFALQSSETQNTEENPLNWEYAIARHFAEWGRNHFEDKSEMVSEDLEEEIDRYYSDWQFDDDTIYEDMRDICRHFAEWQKQKDKQLVGATQKISHQHGYDEGRSDMKEEMKEHINNIISYLEEFLQPGFPIFKADISKEITWLNSLIIKND